MSLSPGDTLFEYYNNNTIPKHGKFSFFGTDFGTVAGFSQYIDGYIIASESLFETYKSTPYYQINVFDSLVYPLCFIYRQVVELYIKYFYFKYANTDETDKKAFISTVSHQLNKAWKKTRPLLEPLIEKIQSNVDLDLLGNLIEQIDKFDTRSMRMRYPINPDLSSVHVDGSVKLNTIHLHHKMMELFDYFKYMDFQLENVLTDNTCEDGFTQKIINLYSVSKNEIDKTIELLSLACKENEEYINQKEFTSADISNIDDFTDESLNMLDKYIDELDSSKAALIALLTHTGLNIYDGCFKLAVDPEEKIKDFMKAMELTLEECSFINFEGLESNESMCYALFEKSPELLLKWLKTSITYMDNQTKD